VIEESRGSGRNHDEELRALAGYWTQWNYARRVEWENDQLKKLGSVPVIGRMLVSVARRVLKKWFGVYGIP
jgi:hypothetical protein